MSLPSDIVSQGINYSLLARALYSVSGAITDNGTVSNSTSTTLTDTTKAWNSNQWINYIVQITGGIGAGQVRKIISNTSNTITIDSPWLINPDKTSSYIIFQSARVIVNHSPSLIEVEFTTSSTPNTVTQVSTDTTLRKSVTILADSSNTAPVLVGTSTSANFPLAPGASVTIDFTTLASIYAQSSAASQKLHIIAGGS